MLFGLGLLCRTTACFGLCCGPFCPRCALDRRLFNLRALYSHSAACLRPCNRGSRFWVLCCAGHVLSKWGRHCNGAKGGLCCGDACVLRRGLAQLRCVIPQLLLQVARSSLYM